jgi:hypothetical protein
MNNMFQLMTSLDKRLDAMEQKIAVQAPAQPVTAAPQPAPAMTQPPIQAQPQPIQAQPQMLPGLGIVMQGQPVDLFTVMRFIQGLPPEQKRMYFGPQAAEKPGDQQLQVFQQLDSDHAWVDIMESLNIGFEDMQRYVEKYNTMKKLSAEKENLGSPYLAAWYDACKVIGENVRRGCSHFNEPDGTCQRWALEDIPKQYRDTYRGMYRSIRNKEGYLFNVERNAEICAVCQRAKIVEGED